MTRGYVPQRDENGNEDWSIMRVDLDYEVPDHVLDDAPSGEAVRLAATRGTRAWRAATSSTSCWTTASQSVLTT